MSRTSLACLQAGGLLLPSFKAEIAVGVDPYILHTASFCHAAVETTPLQDCNWATLFSYMHCRFGLPHMRSMDLGPCVGWLLTTPDPELFVSVVPSTCAGQYFFEVLTSCTPILDWRVDKRLGFSPERVEAFVAAYRATLFDLLRPVRFDVEQIDALGRIEGSWPPANNEGRRPGEDIIEAKASRHFSEPMPSGLFGGESWDALCRIISSAGDGDFSVGKDRVLADLRKSRLVDLGEVLTWPVLRLMVMSQNDDARDMLLESLAQTGMDPLLIASSLADERRLLEGRGPGWEEMVLAEMTPEVADLAASCLESIGMSGWSVSHYASRKREWANLKQIYDQLAAIISDLEIPAREFSISKQPVSRPLSVAEIRDCFVRAGVGDLVDWVDQANERENGDNLLRSLSQNFVGAMVATNVSLPL